MPPWAPILYVGRCSECLTAKGHDFHLEGGARWKRARLPMATRLRPSRGSTGRVGLRKTGKVGTGCGVAAANIVQVFDFDQVEGRYYIAMELVRGHTLREVVERCREQAVRFGVARAVHVCWEV